MKKIFSVSLLLAGVAIGYYSKPIIDEAISGYKFFRSAQVYPIDKKLDDKFEEEIDSEFNRRGKKGLEIPVDNVQIYQRDGNYLIKAESKGISYSVGLKRNKEKSDILYFFRD